jgi:hypothetical protein
MTLTMFERSIKIKLSVSDMADCRQAANFRWQLNRMSGIVNSKVDESRSQNVIELLGVKAELAVAKCLDIPHFYQPGFDDGSDMFLGDISIDVKATFHAGGQLLFRTADHFKANCAVLVTSTDADDVMLLAGWLPRKQFLERAVEIDLGRGPTLACKQDELLSMSELWHADQKRKFQKAS